MNKQTRRTREQIIGDAIPIEQWPEPIIEGLAPDSQEKYWRNRKALELYATGHTEADIRKATQLRLKRVSQMFISGGSINALWKEANGFHVCVPGWIKPRTNKRRKPLPCTGTGESVSKGLAGALGRLFELYPTLLKVMLNLVHKLQNPDGYKANVITTTLAHEVFLEQCRKIGLNSNDYPLNTKHRGKSAIREWLKQELAKNPLAHADGLYGAEAKRDASRAHTAASSMTKYPRELAYGRGELDGHLHDSLWEIFVVLDGHTFEFESALRPMLVRLIECRTKVTLAHTLTFKGQYSRAHFMTAILNSLRPWEPMDLSDFAGSDFAYRDGAGFPSMIEDFAWHMLREIAWDRHTAQVAAASSMAIRSALGIHSTAMEGPGEGAARGSIEGGFGQLSNESRHLLNATGLNPGDVARRAPEKSANKYFMHQNLAQVFFDVWLANLNAKPARVGGLTPLEQLQGCLNNGQFYNNPLSESERARVLWQLLPQYKRKLNRAKKKTGPFYIELFGGARYSSPEIARNMSLLRCEGVDVTLYVEDDARFAHLVVPEPNNPSGRYMGRLRVHGQRWNYPHPIEERILMDKIGRKNVADYEAKYKSTSLALNACLAFGQKSSKQAANAAAGIAAEMAMKRQFFPLGPSLTFTPEELDLSAELDPDDGYELENESAPLFILEPSKPLNPEWPGFGGRVL